MLIEIVNVIVCIIEMGIDLFIFSRLSDGVRRRWLLPITTVLGTVAMIGMDKFQVNNTFKLVCGILLVSILSYLSFYMQIHHVIQGALLMWVGTMVAELLAVGILMVAMGSDFIGEFTVISELQIQGAIFSKIILFALVVIVTNVLRKQDERYSWRELSVLLLQISTCMFTLILTVELARQEEEVLNISPIYFCVMAIACLLVYFVSYYITAGYFQSRREKMELIQMEAMAKQQMQYYEHKLDTQQQVKSLYHDMKNHMIALRELHKSSDEEWDKYMKAMELQVKPYKENFQTGNLVIDALLYEKKKIAEADNVIFEIYVEKNCIRDIPNVVLCTVLGNGLDNALEAVSRVTEGERRIVISLTDKISHLNISIVNNYEGEVIKKNGEYITRKNKKENHGIGMKSIQRVVQDCQGNMSVDTKNHVFELFIILPYCDKKV